MDLNSKTVKDLRAIARERKLKGFSSLRKAQLIEYISTGKRPVSKPKKSAKPAKLTKPTKPKTTKKHPKLLTPKDDDLPDGIHVYRNFVEDHDTWFHTLRNKGDWKDVKWGPRGISLGRKTTNSKHFQSMTLPLMRMIEVNAGTNIVASWGNWYKDGNDHAGYHKDNYGDITLFTISLGGTRSILFKPDDRTKPTIKLTLNSGDMYSFSHKINQKYTHSVPRSKTMTDERISVLFFEDS